MERGIVSAGRNKLTGAHNYPNLELVRLTIPRRVYTQSHIEYVLETFEEILKRKKEAHGLKITFENKFLRHFTAHFDQL